VGYSLKNHVANPIYILQKEWYEEILSVHEDGQIRMSEDGEPKGQPANPGLPGNWLLKRLVYWLHLTMHWNLDYRDDRILLDYIG